MKNHAAIWTAIIIILVLSGFVVKGYLKENYPAPVASNNTYAVFNSVKAWDKQLLDSTVSLLRNGDIALRRGIGPDSYILAEMNRDDKTYSHCGIVIMENGYPFVYHSIGGEDNPDERLRRDSATFFFSPLHNTHIAIVRYDLDSRKKERLAGIVHHYYKSRPRFDMKFDLATDDRLYCSEFIYKALNAATGDSDYIRPYFHAGRRMVGIDNLLKNPHMQLIRAIKFK